MSDPDHASAAPERGGPIGLLELWFGARRPVRRLTYLASGLSLLALAYVLERAVIQAATGRILSPLAFLTRTLPARNELLRGAPEVASWLLVALALPFLWIAVSMSARRAAAAGRSPWLGVLVMVPLLNLLVVAALVVLPSRPAPAPVGAAEPRVRSSRRILLRGLLAGLAVGFLALLLAVYVLQSYGAGLFMGVPLVMGAVACSVAGRAGGLSLGASLALGSLAAALGSAALLLGALEGGLCLAMALPLVVPLGMLGGVVGHRLTLQGLAQQGPMQQGLARQGARATPTLAAVLALPLFAGLETASARLLEPPPLHEVLTNLDVDAPPERLWPLLLALPELPPPDDWIFRLGIAHPLSTHTEGEGRGALRHDVFSTGAFVERITTWEPPYRLAFDVASQPAPMTEWSPWGAIDAPHLHDYLRVRRGEIRLKPLPGGRTRVQARTWYELDMAPRAYWQVWGNSVIHRVHERVLQHIARLSEASVPARKPGCGYKPDAR